MVPRVINLNKAAVHHASLSAARCESEAEDEKESLQRATIKLTKYHYQIFNKVGAIR